MACIKGHDHTRQPKQKEGSRDEKKVLLADDLGVVNDPTLRRGQARYDTAEGGYHTIAQKS